MPITAGRQVAMAMLQPRTSYHQFSVLSDPQVHKAKLHDGSDVAVKVQYLGLEAAVAADLSTLTALGFVAAILFPNSFDFGCDSASLLECMSSLWEGEAILPLTLLRISGSGMADFGNLVGLPSSNFMSNQARLWERHQAGVWKAFGFSSGAPNATDVDFNWPATIIITMRFAVS